MKLNESLSNMKSALFQFILYSPGTQLLYNKTGLKPVSKPVNGDDISLLVKTKNCVLLWGVGG